MLSPEEGGVIHWRAASGLEMWALLLCEHGPLSSTSLFLPQVASWWRQALAFVSRQKATVVR